MTSDRNTHLPRNEVVPDPIADERLRDLERWRITRDARDNLLVRCKAIARDVDSLDAAIRTADAEVEAAHDVLWRGLKALGPLDVGAERWIAWEAGERRQVIPLRNRGVAARLAGATAGEVDDIAAGTPCEAHGLTGPTIVRDREGRALYRVTSVGPLSSVVRSELSDGAHAATDDDDRGEDDVAIG